MKDGKEQQPKTRSEAYSQSDLSLVEIVSKGKQSAMLPRVVSKDQSFCAP